MVEDRIRSYNERAVAEKKSEHAAAFLPYPFESYNFDFRGELDTQFNPDKFKIKPKGTIQQLVRNVDGVQELVRAMVMEPVPNNDTKAGISDLGRVPKQDRARVAAAKAKAALKAEPYNGFFKDYPDAKEVASGSGQTAANVYMPVGECPTGLKDKQICIAKGLKWDGNECKKPQYALVRNDIREGIPGLTGILSSIVDDVSEFSPDVVLGVLQGQSVNDGATLQCPPLEVSDSQSQEIEGFNNKSKSGQIDKDLVEKAEITSGFLIASGIFAGLYFFARGN